MDNNKQITVDEYYVIERPIGYTPMGFLTTEDEIRSMCDREQILVKEITKFEGYNVKGKKIENKEDYLKLKDAISK